MPAARRGMARRTLVDGVATRVVTGGGVVIIGAILAILVVIAAEVVQLFRSASAKALPGISLPAGPPPLVAGVDEYREEAFVLSPGGIAWIPLSGAAGPPPAPLPERGGAEIVAAVPGPKGSLAAGLSDGRLLPIQVSFAVTYDGQRRTVTPSVAAEPPLAVDPAGRPLGLFAWAATPDGPVAAAVTGPHEISLVLVRETSSMLGEKKREDSRVPVRVDLRDKASPVLE